MKKQAVKATPKVREVLVSDQFYIEQHRNTQSVEEMSRSLKLPESIIQDIVDKASVQSVAEIKPPTLTRIALDNRPGSVAEKYGVKVMTPAGSELGDAATKANKGQKKVGRDDCIFRPKG